MIQFSLLLSFRLCCFLALFFHIIILSRYAAAVQNSYSLFTFAFFQMVFSFGPFLLTLLTYSVAFLPLFSHHYSADVEYPLTMLLLSKTNDRSHFLLKKCCLSHNHSLIEFRIHFHFPVQFHFLFVLLLCRFSHHSLIGFRTHFHFPGYFHFSVLLLCCFSHHSLCWCCRECTFWCQIYPLQQQLSVTAAATLHPI